MSKKLAVCLVSGGMDSTVSAAIAATKYDVAFLHISYGQRTQKRELKAFRQIADFYNVEKRLEITLSHFKEIGGSALTDSSIKVPEGKLSGSSEIPITYVPFRNAHFLSVAVSWAEIIGANYIYIGATEVDYSGYPDCRGEFIEAFNKVIELGTKPETHIKIVAPLLRYKKSDVVKKGLELNVPFDLTWSCYQDEDVACGRCESCLLRLKGFKEAGVKDPIKYKERQI